MVTTVSNSKIAEAQCWDHRARFARERGAFAAAAAAVHRAALTVESARAAVVDHRAALALVEAAWLLEGLTLPDGAPCKNETQREAVLTVRRATDPARKRAQAALDSALVAQAAAQAELERARDERSLARRGLDYVLAVMQLTAAGDEPDSGEGN